MSEPVLTEVSDGVAVITINRPEARNAVNGAVARGMAAAIDDVQARSDVRVLIITGAGGTFSAGMDLKAFLTGETPNVPGRGFGGLVQQPPSKPVIAAVEGYALAGGFELVLACDLIVASAEAKFGLPEVTRGLVAGAGGLLRLPGRIPYHLAMEIALTGDHFSTAHLQAARPGEHRLVPASAGAGAGARSSPPGSRGTRRSRSPRPSGSSSSRADWDSCRRLRAAGRDHHRPVFTSKDAMEGAAAFAEKRAPNWRGE